jgi:hypothetical protein
VEIAFFTLVIDECWRWPNGTLYLDGCTCGSNAVPPPAYQCYTAGDAGIPVGLWYHFGITDQVIRNVTDTIGNYKKLHPEQLVVAFFHLGPNFQWKPYALHEQLFRNVSQVSDVVWGTSAHHIQKFEIFGTTPIIYGMGDLLFRHEVGVVDFCPIYAVPCESYRTEIAMNYKFEVLILLFFHVFILIRVFSRLPSPWRDIPRWI